MRALLILLFPIMVMAQEPPPGCGELPPPIHDKWILAYTKQPRLNTPINEPPYAPVFDMANWQHWYDGGRPNRFTEADLVLDDLNGDIRMVYDCTTQDRICAAHDQRVSPDGKSILFTVARGDSLRKVKSAVANTPYSKRAVEFDATSYELWIHDITTNTSALLERDARMGVWAKDWQIVFASCRAGTWPEWAHHGNDFQGDCSLQLYRGDFAPKGGLRNIKPLTPHATMAMGPLVTSDGRLWYSDWWAYDSTRTLKGGKTEPMKKGLGGTPANMYFVASMELNGTDWRVELHAHSTPTLEMAGHLVGVVDPNRQSVKTSRLRLPRHLSEHIWNGKRFMCVSNYYRSNHMGSNGTPYCWEPTGEPEGTLFNKNIAESPYKDSLFGSGQYVPPSLFAFAPYGVDSDDPVRHHKDGRAMGKAGTQHPTTLGTMLYTHRGGICYEGALPQQTFPGFTGGEPSCKADIRVAFVDRVTDPFDEKQGVTVACPEPDVNCFDAVEVVPYRKLYGQREPSVKRPKDPPPNYVTLLRVVNIKDGELWPIPHMGDSNNAKVRLQGNADPDWQSRIAGIRIEQIIPWQKPATRTGFFKERLIGDFYADEKGRLEAMIPCNIMYQFTGIDGEGVELAWDTAKHWATCGEVKTCHGCHVHSIEAWQRHGNKTPEERWDES